MQIVPLLPKLLANEDTWREIFEALDEVISASFTKRVRKLQNRFNVENLSDSSEGFFIYNANDGEQDVKRLIRNFANVLGFAYDDSGVMSDDSYLRFVEQSTSFIHEKGTSKFIDFFSYVINSNFLVDELWYDPVAEEFVRQSAAQIQGRRIVLDGVTDTQDCFPTPYIRLLFNFKSFENIEFDTAQLARLFYSIAPIDIVIQDIVKVVNANVSTINVGYLGDAKVKEYIYNKPKIDVVTTSQNIVLETSVTELKRTRLESVVYPYMKITEYKIIDK